jgi:hypothetical protein
MFVSNPHDVKSEVFTAVTVKNGVFWDVTPCGLTSQKTSLEDIRGKYEHALNKALHLSLLSRSR